MKVLILEDVSAERLILTKLVSGWGYESVVTRDGHEAWRIMQQEDAPQLAIIDWVMPDSPIDGVEVCRRVRRHAPTKTTYLILLTVKGAKKDVVAGLEAGADDYISKPFDSEELRARLKVGKRIVELQCTLEERIRELEECAAHIRTLQGILPICSYCKCIRDDGDYWHRLENYFATHTDLLFSHTYCPKCYEKYVKPQLKKNNE
jgi:DNA-binding response OmpR family regulator